MDKNFPSLAYHLINSNAPREAWAEYFSYTTPKPSDWLEGKSSLLKMLSMKGNMLDIVAEKLTEALGVDIWITPIDGVIPFTHLIDRLQKLGNQAYKKDLSCSLAAAARRLDFQQIETLVRQYLDNENSNKDASSLNVRSWLGKPRNFWKNHPLEIPAALVELNLGKAALAIAKEEWDQPDEDGINLAYLFMHNSQAWGDWLQSGRSIESLVYVDQKIEKDNPVPMYRWMVEKGNLFEGVVKRAKEDGQDMAFEPQLQRTGWRSAMARRANWREWQGSAGRNALHIIARHHPVSFLTSQAIAEANQPLLGKLDANGDDCINHMVIGLLENLPERKGSFWYKAMENFNNVMNRVIRETKAQGEPGRGIVAAMVQNPPKEQIPHLWMDTIGSYATGVLLNNPEKTWAGLDKESAILMIQNYAQIPKYANFASTIILKEVGDGMSDAFWNTAAEARMILLSHLITNANQRAITEARLDKLVDVFHQTMNEEMDLPEKVLENFKHLISVQMKKAKPEKTTHLRMMSTKILHMELSDLVNIKEKEEPTRPKVKI